MIRAFLLLALSLALSGPARAQETAPRPLAAPVTPAYRFQAGETLTYRINAAISGRLPAEGGPPQNADIRFDFDLAVRAVDVADDGSARLVPAIPRVAITWNGQPVEMDVSLLTMFLPRSVTLAPSGQIVATQAGAPLPLAIELPGFDMTNPAPLLFPLVFPGRPLRQGEEWAPKPARADDPKAIATEYRWTLAGADPERDDALVVRGRSRTPLSRAFDSFGNVVADPKQAARVTEGQADGTLEVHFSESAGRLVRSRTEVRMKMTAREAGAARAVAPESYHLESKITVELLPAGPAPDAPAAPKENP